MSAEHLGATKELPPPCSPHIPLDKSWLMRMGVLDLIHIEDRTRFVLGRQEDLSDDLTALEGVFDSWYEEGEPIRVGESGTLYRFLQYTSWQQGLDKKFILNGTLENRPITIDSTVLHMSQSDLLVLDHGTSQWASAAALNGDPERLKRPPFKLALTYEAIEAHKIDGPDPYDPIVRYDTTIDRQARAFLEAHETGDALEFEPLQAEDYCLAQAFDLITPEEAEGQWSSLRGHETDRLREMWIARRQAETGQAITSKDHRVIQAMAMWGNLMNRIVEFSYPKAVEKSWPTFWDFIGENR